MNTSRKTSKGAKRQPNGTKQLSRKAQRRANQTNPVTPVQVTQKPTKHGPRVPFKEREGSRFRNESRNSKLFETLPEDPAEKDWGYPFDEVCPYDYDCSSEFFYPEGFWDDCESDSGSDSCSVSSESDEEDFFTLDDLARSGNILL